LVVGQTDLDSCAPDVDPEEVGGLGLIERYGFLLGHDGKKEGAAEDLGGEKWEWSESIAS
jgi:hypothetical protein